VDLVNEQDLYVSNEVSMTQMQTDSWHDLGFSFLSPLGDLGVDLISKLWLDFSRVAYG
jgi:hypothetical protein